MKVDYICPFCAGKINLIGSKNYCLECGRQFAIDENIPILSENSDFYYGEVSKDLMIKLLSECDKIGWEKAFSNLLSMLPDPQFISDYVLAEKRSSWKFLLNLSSNYRALDLGCGWGSTALSLAESYGEVVAADLTPERLKFLQKRCSSLGIKNISFVCCGDATYLPFPNGYFNTVVLNGVLEWVAVSRKGGPKDIQTQYLREVYRILNENGVLYIGIENRYSYRYFLGRPDDHTGLMYGSLMPRVIANFYSHHIRGVPYRTYTYSRMGYKNMIKKSGFSGSYFFIPVPDYRNFTQIIDPSDKNNMSYFTRNSNNSHLKQKLKFKLDSSLPLAYSILCYKGKREIFYTNLLDHIIQNDFHCVQLGHISNRIDEYYVASSAGTVIIKVNSEPKGFVVKLPTCKMGLLCLEHNSIILSRLWEERSLPKKLMEVIPRSISANKYLGQSYFVETRIDGDTGYNLAKKYIYEPLKQQAFEFIKEFHLATRKISKFDENLYDRQIGCHIRSIMRWIDYKHDKLNNIEKYIIEAFIGRQIPLVWGHGDFWLGNLLFNKSQELVGVIDWDLSYSEFLPVVDPAYFLCNSYYELNSTSFGSALIQQLFSGELLKTEYDLWQDYCGSMGLDYDIDSLMPFFVVCWLISLDNIGSRAIRLKLSKKWIRDIFCDVVDQVHASILRPTL